MMTDKLWLAVGGAMTAAVAIAGETDASLQVWYHQCSEFASPEGITADFRAMRDAGVRRAYYFNAGYGDGLPEGAPVASDGWLRNVERIIAEAKTNGIELGFHNCPGWSSSGGPWIKPEDSMKMYTWGETETTLREGRLKLNRGAVQDKYFKTIAERGVKPLYRDFAVVAIPLERETPKAVKTEGEYPGDVIYGFDRKFSPADIRFSFFDPEILNEKGEVFGEVDGKWVKIGAFEWDGLSVGYVMLPKSVALDEIVTDRIKVVFKPMKRPRPNKLLKTEFSEISPNAAYGKFGLSSWQSGSLAFYEPPTRVAKRPVAENAVYDVTSQLQSDGTLDWRAPADAKAWKILRFGYTATGRWNCSAPKSGFGLECDKLSKRGLDAHWPNLPAKIMRLKDAKDVIKVILLDSYEADWQTWTEGFDSEFKARRGYALTTWLPALAGYTVGSAERTARFWWDYRKTIADLYAENYYDHFAFLAHKEGCLAAVEPYSGPFDGARVATNFDIVMGEFWIGGSLIDSPRLAASIAHTRGRKFTGAEAFTSGSEKREKVTTAELRRQGDLAWAEGVSQFICHSYVHQPSDDPAKMVTLGPFGSFFNRHSRLWREIPEWAKYVAGGQRWLQAGKPIADVLVLRGEGDLTKYGKNAYPVELVARSLTFDYLGPCDLPRLRADGGGCVRFADLHGGVPYRAVAMGNDTHFTVATLKELKRLADGGVRIIGRRPLGTPSLADDESLWNRLTDDIWSGKRKNVMVTDGLKPRLGVERVTKGRAMLLHHDRRIDGEYLFFVCNPAECGEFDGVIRLSALAKCQLAKVNVVTGSRTPIAVSTDSDDALVPLKLDPGESIFLFTSCKR